MKHRPYYLLPAFSGKLLLWTLAIIGCMDRPANAQGALTESGGSDTSAALAQAPTENLDAISHGPRLAGTETNISQSVRSVLSCNDCTLFFFCSYFRCFRFANHGN